MLMGVIRDRCGVLFTDGQPLLRAVFTTLSRWQGQRLEDARAKHTYRLCAQNSHIMCESDGDG